MLHYAYLKKLCSGTHEFFFARRTRTPSPDENAETLARMSGTWNLDVHRLLASEMPHLYFDQIAIASNGNFSSTLQGSPAAVGRVQVASNLRVTFDTNDTSLDSFFNQFSYMVIFDGDDVMYWHFVTGFDEGTIMECCYFRFVRNGTAPIIRLNPPTNVEFLMTTFSHNIQWTPAASQPNNAFVSYRVYVDGVFLESTTSTSLNIIDREFTSTKLDLVFTVVAVPLGGFNSPQDSEPSLPAVLTRIAPTAPDLWALTLGQFATDISSNGKFFSSS